MKKLLITYGVALFLLFVAYTSYAKEENIKNMWWSYAYNRITYYEIAITDKIAGYLIPQNPVALDTYKWYRAHKKYGVEKSIKLTIKNWKLNLGDVATESDKWRKVPDVNLGRKNSIE